MTRMFVELSRAAADVQEESLDYDKEETCVVNPTIEAGAREAEGETIKCDIKYLICK